MKDAKIELNSDNAKIETKEEVPKQVQEEFRKIVDHIVPEIKNLEFVYVKP